MKRALILLAAVGSALYAQTACEQLQSLKLPDTTITMVTTVPAGAFRGYGLGQVTFAVESAMDELARRLGIDPLVFRERNIIGPGEHMISPGGEEEDLHIASYGLDQCLKVVRDAIAEDTSADQAPEGWLVGQGTASPEHAAFVKVALPAIEDVFVIDFWAK